MFSIGAETADESGKKGLKAPTAHTSADCRLGAPTKRKKPLTVRRQTAWAPVGGADGAYQAPIGFFYRCQRPVSGCKKTPMAPMAPVGGSQAVGGAYLSARLQAVCRRSKTPTGAYRRPV